MLMRGSLNPKYTKRILSAVILVAILLGLGIFVSRQASSLNLSSGDILKIFASNPFELPKECLDEDKDGNKRWSCFRHYFETLTNKVSASAAMSEAIKLKYQRTTSECHLFAHYIGAANLEKHNFDMGKAFSSCTSGCNDGCFHGVMERAIRNESDPYSIIPRIKNVCDSLVTNTGGKGTNVAVKYRCVHGTGHGLAAHNYLPIQDAVSACNAFGPDYWVDVCIGGLLMENVSEYRDLDLGEDNLRKILPQICVPFESLGSAKEAESSDIDLASEPEGQKQVYKIPQIQYTEPTKILDKCVAQIALGLLDYTGYNIERTKELCEELQRQDHISICRRHIPFWVESQKPSNIDAIKLFENHGAF